MYKNKKSQFDNCFKINMFGRRLSRKLLTGFWVFPFLLLILQKTNLQLSIFALQCFEKDRKLA